MYVIIFGFFLSIYALYEVTRLNKDPNYKPICDFSELASCSRAFFSREGNHFGLPNPFFGVLFYIMCFIALTLRLEIVLNYLLLFGLVSTVYLGYVLYFRIKSICVVCTLIYLVNIIMFIIVF